MLGIADIAATPDATRSPLGDTEGTADIATAPDNVSPVVQFWAAPYAVLFEFVP